MLIYAALTLALVLSICLSTVWYGRRFYLLANLPLAEAPLPRLSVIVPACNEEATVQATAASILGQDYPDLELILVNDRSTDRTGERMAQVAAAHPGRARALAVDKLPEGWLGKNHALWLGARQATGDWLLFTDADVLFDPSCFRRAVDRAEARGLDHLALFPRLVTHSFLLGAWIGHFISMHCTYGRNLAANDPRSPVGTGCGGFNLVRRSAYEAIGGHRPISLRPDDDLRLGLRLKRSGFRQEALSGAGLAEVEWYPSLGAAIRGLEKNSYAVAGYSVLQLLAMCGALFALDCLPSVLVWFAAGLARWLLAATVIVQFAAFLYTNGKTRTANSAYLLLWPLLSLTLIYTVTRASWLTLRQGGMYWRGTFYPLGLLRSQTGLEDLPVRNRSDNTGSN